jgi:hypothetical protein
MCAVVGLGELESDPSLTPARCRGRPRQVGPRVGGVERGRGWRGAGWAGSSQTERKKEREKRVWPAEKRKEGGGELGRRGKRWPAVHVRNKKEHKKKKREKGKEKEFLVSKKRNTIIENRINSYKNQENSRKLLEHNTIKQNKIYTGMYAKI